METKSKKISIVETVCRVLITKRLKYEQPQLHGKTTEERSKELVKWFQTVLPVFKNYLPLAVGINKKLHQEFPTLSKKVINMAVHRHTHEIKYIRQIAKEYPDRVNLNGEVIQPVDQISIANAKKQWKDLKRVLVKVNQRRHQKS